MLKGSNSQEMPNDLYYALIEFADSERTFREQIRQVVEVLEKDDNHENIREFINKKIQEIIERVQKENDNLFAKMGMKKEECTEKQRLQFKFLSEKNEYVTSENYQEIIDLYTTIGSKNQFRTSLSELSGFSLFLISADREVDYEIKQKYISNKNIVLQKVDETQVKAFFMKNGEVDSITLDLTKLDLNANALQDLKFPEKTDEIKEIRETYNKKLVGVIADQCRYIRFNEVDYQKVITKLLGAFFYYDFTSMISAIIKVSKIIEFYLEATNNVAGISDADKGILNQFLIVPVQRIPRLILLVAEITKKILNEDTLADLQSIWRKFGRIAKFYNEYLRTINDDPFNDELFKINTAIADEISATVIMSVKSKTSATPEESIQEVTKNMESTVALMTEMKEALKVRNSIQIPKSTEEKGEKEEQLPGKSGKKEAIRSKLSGDRDKREQKSSNYLDKQKLQRNIARELIEKNNNDNKGNSSGKGKDFLLQAQTMRFKPKPEATSSDASKSKNDDSVHQFHPATPTIKEKSLGKGITVGMAKHAEPETLKSETESPTEAPILPPVPTLGKPEANKYQNPYKDIDLGGGDTPRQRKRDLFGKDFGDALTNAAHSVDSFFNQKEKSDDNSNSSSTSSSAKPSPNVLAMMYGRGGNK